MWIVYVSYRDLELRTLRRTRIYVGPVLFTTWEAETDQHPIVYEYAITG